MLTVQVKGGDGQGGASKSKARSAKADKQTKLTTSMLPPSTNISSPMTKSKKQKGKGKAAVVYDDDSEEEQYEMHDNGYAMDNFVVDDDSFDDDDFEQMPISRHKRQKGPVGPPIANDVELDSLDRIHQHMMATFEEEAMPIAADIQNQHTYRKPVFTRQQFRIMIKNWTLTLDEMADIPDVDQNKVKLHGPRFLAKIREYHHQYAKAFEDQTANASMNTTARRVSAHSVVDLVSESDENMEDDEVEDEEDDGEDSHYFGGGGSQNVPAEVRRWNAEMDELQNKAPATSSRPRSTSSGPREGAGRFAKAGRRAYRKASGSSQRSKGGAGVKKKAPSKRVSTGSARSASSTFGSASRGGRGGSRSAAGGSRQATLEMAGRIGMMPH